MYGLLRSTCLAVAMCAASCAVAVTSVDAATQDTSFCPEAVASGDAAALANHIEKIRVARSFERRVDLMVEFRSCIDLRGLAALQNRKLVMALAALLDDPATVVHAAYLLGDIGAAARPVLPKMNAILAMQPNPADAYGFTFGRDGKPIGALEYAIAQIERSSN